MEKYYGLADGFTINGMWNWMQSLSERTLTLASITILHLAFIPNLLAYANAITEKLPNLDSFILVLGALFIMMLRSIIKQDMLVVTIHSIGFVSQCALFAFILLR